MEPLFYVMAIMGCGDGMMGCQQVRLVEARYESPTACAAATATMLHRNSDIDYPVVAAQCRASGPIMAANDSARVSRP